MSRRKAAASREQTLLQIVFMMWLELGKPWTQQDRDKLEADIRAEGHGWALPAVTNIDDDELLTAQQLSNILGYSASTIRVWPARHGIPQYDGRFRWGDIHQFIRSRTPR